MLIIGFVVIRLSTKFLRVVAHRPGGESTVLKGMADSFLFLGKWKLEKHTDLLVDVKVVLHRKDKDPFCLISDVLNYYPRPLQMRRKKKGGFSPPAFNF